MRADILQAFDDVAVPRRLRAGRSYVYVLPCADDTLLKIGFSRDPLQRFRTLRPRFFRAFDLDRGLLVETARVHEARTVERHLLQKFARWSAPAPVWVPNASAGHTEWYRGVHDEAVATASECAAAGGHRLHAPLKPWLRERLRERSELLYGWSERMLDVIEFERFNDPLEHPCSRAAPALRDALDACCAVGLAAQALVPPLVWEWYTSGADVHA